MNHNQTKTSEKTHFFIDLYQQYFPIVARHIQKNSGDLDDAKDLFQDALILFYEKKLLEPSINNGYLFGICRNLWSKKLRDEPRIKIELDTNLSVKEEDSELSIQTISTFMENAGRRCKDILVSFYYEKLSLEKIALKFGFKSTRSATVQKFKCIEKMRALVKEKQLEYADFIK